MFEMCAEEEKGPVGIQHDPETTGDAKGDATEAGNIGGKGTAPNPF